MELKDSRNRVLKTAHLPYQGSLEPGQLFSESLLASKVQLEHSVTMFRCNHESIKMTSSFNFRS